jgi:hypothetical protein
MLSIEDFGSWSGMSTGRFHVDSLGVKTNPEFWNGIRPTKPGKITVAPPIMGSAYFEYAACAMAATVTEPMHAFRVLEIGAAWGVWSVRAAAIARRLGIPVHTTAIEALPTHCRNIAWHLMTNGLDPACHDIIQTVLAQEAGERWFRFHGDVDLGARIVLDEWVERNAAIPEIRLPDDMPIPCKDGSAVRKMPARSIADVVTPGSVFDLVHLRIGPGPGNVLDGAVFPARHMGVVVIPNIADADVAKVDERMSKLGYREVLSIAAGTTIPTARQPAVIDRALRIFTGHRVREAVAAEMAARLGAMVAGTQA